MKNEHLHETYPSLSSFEEFITYIKDVLNITILYGEPEFVTPQATPNLTSPPPVLRINRTTPVSQTRTITAHTDSDTGNVTFMVNRELRPYQNTSFFQYHNRDIFMNTAEIQSLRNGNQEVSDDEDLVFDEELELEESTRQLRSVINRTPTPPPFPRTNRNIDFTSSRFDLPQNRVRTLTENRRL